MKYTLFRAAVSLFLATAFICFISIYIEKIIDYDYVVPAAKILAGNWDYADFKNPEQRYLASIAAVFAIILNNGLIFLLLGLCWKYLNLKRENLMKISAVFAMKDEILMQAVIEELGSEDEKTTNRIYEAFEKGEATWKKMLRKVYSVDIVDIENVLKNDEVLKASRQTN